ncbi:MAG TPA: hypothetical protein VMX55_12320 [candidate division Zixibacteria bacterium]|nr:hypothetical protein [candidate division Zixibacteria bacterium]
MHKKVTKLSYVILLSILSISIIGLQINNTQAGIPDEIITETKLLCEDWNLFFGVRYYKLDITTTIRFNIYGDPTIYKQRIYLYTTTSGMFPPSMKDFSVDYNGNGDYWKGYSPDIYRVGALAVSPIHKTDSDTFYISRDNVILYAYCWYDYVDGAGFIQIVSVGYISYQVHT